MRNSNYLLTSLNSLLTLHIKSQNTYSSIHLISQLSDSLNMISQLTNGECSPTTPWSSMMQYRRKQHADYLGQNLLLMFNRDVLIILMWLGNWEVSNLARHSWILSSKDGNCKRKENRSVDLWWNSKLMLIRWGLFQMTIILNSKIWQQVVGVLLLFYMNFLREVFIYCLLMKTMNRRKFQLRIDQHSKMLSEI